MKRMLVGKARIPQSNHYMSKHTLAFLSMKPGESITVPVSEAINARAKISRLHREGKGSWTTRIDKKAGVIRVVKL